MPDRSPRRRHSRRTSTLLTGGVLLVGLLIGVAALPVPYVRFAPGSTFNAIGSYDGVELITISGTTTYPTAGHLDITTVSENGGPFGRLGLGDALRGWWDHTLVVLPREVVYPERTPDPDDVRQQNEVAFTTSQSSAVAAAMRHLGRPVVEKAFVASVTTGSPAAGKLKAGDVIESIDGTPVSTPDQVGAVIRSKPIGTALTFVVLRNGVRQEVVVTSAPNPEDPAKSYVGIVVAVDYQATFPITFGLQDVGGPSAGLMFAMGIVDKLTPGELNGGRFVAGTGTIDPQGAVGAIGGIQQKLAGARGQGAELFLAPKSNCPDVVGAVPDGLTVTPVETLDQAVRATEAWVAGRPVPSCPA